MRVIKKFIKTASKAIIKNIMVKKFLCKLTYYYINLVHRLGNWQIIYPADVNLQELIKKPAIYAFWHGRLIMMPKLNPPGFVMNVLISDHKDGELISMVMKYFGFNTISGSTSRNALPALREIIAKLKLGQNIAITPDGPRGPNMKINSSVVSIARITGAPIIPISFSCSSSWVFKSWDRFMLPKLFCRGILIYGKPFCIDKNTNSDELKLLELELEEEMIAITEHADHKLRINNLTTI